MALLPKRSEMDVITRFADAAVPMDEALRPAALDVGGGDTSSSKEQFSPVGLGGIPGDLIEYSSTVSVNTPGSPRTSRSRAGTITTSAKRIQGAWTCITGGRSDRSLISDVPSTKGTL